MVRVSATRIKKRQAELTDIDAKLDACERGLSGIKDRIAFLLPEETQQKIDRLNKDYEPLKAEEAELYKLFFSKCAEAIAIKEQIKGKEYIYHSYKWFDDGSLSKFKRESIRSADE